MTAYLNVLMCVMLLKSIENLKIEEQNVKI